MNSDALKQELKKASKTFAENHGFLFDDKHSSALIFLNPEDTFHPKSWENILHNPEWLKRTQKPHQNVPGTLEMQSSNSSDAILMNIFCHPDIGKWKGLQKLIGDKLDSICFGHSAKVLVNNGKEDATEIDMKLSEVYCEAKLTETDFTQKSYEIVELYDNLQKDFIVENLPRKGDKYDNYQIIRNLLAAIQDNKGHILLCDERRPDLVRRYYETVVCLKEIQNREKCRVIFWQEIVQVCGHEFRAWMKEKYGMS